MHLLTYSMVQSPSWEANWFAASQEIPRISRNQKVHYRTHKRPPPVSILGQLNPVHIPTSHLLEMHPNIIHPSMPRSPKWSPSLRFPQKDPIQPPLLTHMRHMPSPSHSTRFYHPQLHYNLHCWTSENQFFNSMYETKFKYLLTARECCNVVKFNIGQMVVNLVPTRVNSSCIISHVIWYPPTKTLQKTVTFKFCDNFTHNTALLLSIHKLIGLQSGPALQHCQLKISYQNLNFNACYTSYVNYSFKT